MARPSPVPWSRRILWGAMGLALLSLLGSELVVRLTRPAAPGLVWSDPGVELMATSWGPTWHMGTDAMERRRAGCPGGAEAGDRRRVELVGADLLHGVGLGLDEAPGPALQRALAARADVPVCVETLAEPGLPFNAQLAATRAALYGQSAEALVWAVAPQDAWPAVRQGPALHVFGPSGGLMGQLPVPVEPLLHSRLLSILLHRKLPGHLPSDAQWEEFLEQALPAMVDAAQAANARLLVLARPALDRPFPDQVAAQDPRVAVLQARCAAAGIPFLDLAAEMGDTEPADLQSGAHSGTLDADGAETLAELLAPTLQRLLAERPAVALGARQAQEG